MPHIFLLFFRLANMMYRLLLQSAASRLLKLVLQVWPSRVQGELGPDALGGRVAFNIASCDGDGYFYSSLLVVTDLRGANVSAKVVPDMTQSADRTSTYGVTHFDGLKVRERSLPPKNVPSLTA